MNYPHIFSEISDQIFKIPDLGKVASYIPELARVNPNQFGVHLTTVDGDNFAFGDAEKKFSIQSIAKVLGLVLAYKIEDENLWKRVGVEPSGTPFNSLVQLETDNGIPRNPLINPGAQVICDILMNHYERPKTDFIEFIRHISGNPSLDYSFRIAESESATGFRNRALVNLMKDFGNIHNDVEAVLDFYFHLCSIEMTCNELARSFLFLANSGVDPLSGERMMSVSKSKRINAIMQLCGFYDEAGEFSFKVGLPGKSGVGGGIAAVLPGKYSIAVWSPRLNQKGNSFRGMQFLEAFTTITESSIF